MNRIALALTCLGLAGAAVACGGGTLGTPGAGGGTGSGSVNTGSSFDGFAGNTPPGPGSAGFSGSAGSPGVGGDGISPPPGGDGGITGRGGVTGIAGSTGRGGVGGRMVACPPPGPPVCGALCGNGFIDTCNSALAPQCFSIIQSEDCDGLELGANTCASRGYGSGTLTCTPTCTIDDSSCSYCAPVGGPMISCGPAPIVFPYVGSFSLAATDREVGLVQIDHSLNADSSRLTFARLDASLAVIKAVGLEDTTSPGPLQTVQIDSAVAAPIGSGWLVAGCATGRLFLHALDANAKKVARTMLSDGTDYREQCSAGTLSLAPAPNGMALLLYQNWYGAIRYLLIGGDGAPQGTSAPLTDQSTVLLGLPSAAWTGDAFTIALPVETPFVYTGVARLLRLTSDGALTTIGDVLGGELTYSPVVVAGAGDIRLVYLGTPPGSPYGSATVLWRRVSAMGQLLTGAVSLGVSPLYVGPNRALAFGDDTIALLTGVYQEQLTLARLDATLSRSYLDVAKTPNNDLQIYDMVRRGPDVVVGWIGREGALMLARLTP